MSSSTNKRIMRIYIVDLLERMTKTIHGNVIINQLNNYYYSKETMHYSFVYNDNRKVNTLELKVLLRNFAVFHMLAGLWTLFGYINPLRYGTPVWGSQLSPLKKLDTVKLAASVALITWYPGQVTRMEVSEPGPVLLYSA